MFFFHCFRCIETLRVCKQVNLFLHSIFFFFPVSVQDSRKWNKMKSFFLHNHKIPKRSFFFNSAVFCFVLFCSFYEYFDIVFLMDISSVFTRVPMVI